jgi:hypothetical protein
MAIDLDAKGPRPSTNPAGERRVVWGGLPDAVIASLEEYKAAGLEYLVAYFGDKESDRYVSDMREFARTVFPKYS